MHLFLIILHIMLSLALIGVILLQPGKDGAQALGGGGGNQMYAPRGQSNLLGQATTAVAGLFMVTSISLAWYSTQGTSSGSELEESIRKLQEEERGAGLKDVTPQDAALDAVPTEAPPAPTDAAPTDAAPTDAVPSSSAAVGGAAAPAIAPAITPAEGDPTPAPASGSGSATKTP